MSLNYSVAATINAYDYMYHTAKYLVLFNISGLAPHR